MSLHEVALASGVPPNTLRRHVQNFPDYLPVWRQGRSLRLPLASVARAAHIAHLYRQGLTIPEVAARLRKDLPDPAQTPRPTHTILSALINALERQSKALERIAKELSLLAGRRRS
ncbi:MAG: MerR family transcriptional regulator [Desulfobaccales bacterium]